MKGPAKARFEAIFSEGMRAKSDLVRIVFLPGTGLVGFATSKKIGNRPRRNRAKRRVREALRTQPDLLEPRLDFVLVVNEAVASAAFQRIQEEVRTVVAKARERWESELASS